MTTGELHLDVLPAAQSEALRRWGPLASRRGFYLAGGTALALQLGHRASIDLDWFRGEPIDDPLRLSADLSLQVGSVSQDTLHAVTQGVKLSFFTYRYPLLETLVPASEFGCGLASILDVAAMKLAAICQRGARKDYFDLVAIGRTGLELDAMLEAYRRKFEVADIAHVLTALTWFGDADKDPEPVLQARESWESVRATLRTWVKRFASR